MHRPSETCVFACCIDPIFRTEKIHDAQVSSDSTRISIGSFAVPDCRRSPRATEVREPLHHRPTSCLGTRSRPRCLWSWRHLGESREGEAGTLLRTPGGFDSGLHSHTADYWAVVVQGTWKHWVPSTGEGVGLKLEPGAHWTQDPHATPSRRLRVQDSVRHLPVQQGSVRNRVSKGRQEWRSRGKP